MSIIQFRGTAPSTSDSERDSRSLSSVDDEDDNWEGWDTDSAKKPCQSLFDDKSFASVHDALEHDKTKYNFDLNAAATKLSLDFHQRVRLINYIRKEKPSAESLISLEGNESFFTDDAYLRPVIEDDPLLQFESDDWSDSEDGIEAMREITRGLPEHVVRHIQKLEEKLIGARASLAEYRDWVGERFAEKLNLTEHEDRKAPVRDDDTHYFTSYAETEIHAVMIQDAVRTSSYASFILKNPALFLNATVLDVGCGTGILSLFAAKAGAKRVIAVDASDITNHTEKIVHDNKMDDIITVIHGKVEEIALPEGIKEVDIIISEWMGYALLYESMLDSVLTARDRFLRPDGIMAPSQCKMMLGLCEGREIYKQRVGFWNDIYGFDLSPMATDVYNDAIIELIEEDSLITDTVVVKDLHIGSISSRSLNFSSPFRLTATRRVPKAQAFVLYFDTFFTPTGVPVPEDAKVDLYKEGEPALAEVWRVPGKTKRKDSSSSKGKAVSFSTGPLSRPTHWKQTVFLLKEPLTVEDGSIITGTFYCRKNEENSRELCVEIHYRLEGDAAEDTVVHMYHVR